MKPIRERQHPKNNTRVLRWLLVSFFLQCAATFGLGAGATSDAGYIYLFSADARFLKMDANSLRIADVGNLWWLKVPEVDGIIQDPSGHRILLRTRVWQLLGIENPSRSQFDMLGLVVLREVHTKGKNALAIQRTIHGPPGKSLSSGKFFDVDGPRLFLTWTGQKEGRQITTVIGYDQDFDASARVNNFSVYPRSCLAENKLYTPRIGIPREITNWELGSTKVESSSYDQVGGANYFSKVAVAFQDCLMVVDVSYERVKRGKANSKVVLYHMENDRVVSEFRVEVTGDFHVLRNGRFIVVDQVEYVPFGQGAARREKVGRLLVFDSSTGERIASLRVPPNGRFVEAPSLERRGYYISPHRLTLLDVGTWTVGASVEVPFESAFLAPYAPR